MSKKIIKGDTVIVITGRDKLKVGKVLSVNGNKVLVDGINEVKKHAKPDPNKNQEGGVVTKIMYIAISNIALYNPFTKKPDYVSFSIINGKKKRVFKSNQKPVGEE